jgi:precorrin-2 dehydrogenase/sirohydrochlorin ferrochelatase
VSVDYPVCLRLASRPVLVVGGGRVAEARALQLLEAGARVTVIASAATERLLELAERSRVRLVLRRWSGGDCAGFGLIFVATDDRRVSEAVARETRASGALLNAADEPDLCDFTVPSFGRRGGVTVAVATGGDAPAIAAVLRRRLQAQVNANDERQVLLSGWIRRRLPRGTKRTQLLRRVAARVEGANG